MTRPDIDAIRETADALALQGPTTGIKQAGREMHELIDHIERLEGENRNHYAAFFGAALTTALVAVYRVMQRHPGHVGKTALQDARAEIKTAFADILNTYKPTALEGEARE